MMTMTRTEESSAVAGAAPVCVLLAFELGERTWKLGFTTGGGQRPRLRSVPAGAIARVAAELASAKDRFQVPVDTAVVSCYEAGREGFWLHRWLVAQGVTSHVVDSSSIEVTRRARRSKSDRLDLGGLLTLLARWVGGDHRCWRVVRIPTEGAEDARHLHRTWEALQQDRTRLINRVQGLLVTAGVRVPVSGDFPGRVATARRWDGTPLPAGVQARLLQTWAQLAFLTTQLTALEAARPALAEAVSPPTAHSVTRLQTLRAIGPIGAWVLSTEIFGWRQIRNGRELGALVGLVPALYQSGETARDLGITRAGNRHVRRLMVQLAWSWLRYQPQSALTLWYQRRFAGGGPRMRRIGIVALARKLLIALWRYVDRDLVPEGAVLKA
jgi:transposase